MIKKLLTKLKAVLNPPKKEADEIAASYGVSFDDRIVLDKLPGVKFDEPISFYKVRPNLGVFEVRSIDPVKRTITLLDPNDNEVTLLIDQLNHLFYSVPSSPEGRF